MNSPTQETNLTSPSPITRRQAIQALICACFLAAAPSAAYPENPKPKVLILIAEAEYHTSTTLPQFARDHLANEFEVTTIQGDPTKLDPLPGLEAALDQADVLLVSMRRRLLPTAQIEALKHYVAAGKPVIGIRTASHAFSLRNQDPPEGLADWQTFDPDVLGGHYTGHHKVGPQVTITRTSHHPILNGVSTDSFKSEGSLYKVNPLDPRATPLLLGSIPSEPAEPIAWTFLRPDGGHSFYTSLGHETDFAQPSFNLLLRNAIRWAASIPEQ